MLKMCLNRFHSGTHEAILKFLPPEDIKMMQEQKLSSSNIEESLLPPEKILERIHYSWLLQPLQKIDPSLQSYVLASLPAKTTFYLSEWISDISKIPPLSEGVKKYFLRYFASLVFDEHTLSPAFVPDGTLPFLKTVTKTQLEEIFDLLGLYDLAPDVRQIVDTQRIKALYHVLSKRQQHFLRIVLHQHDKIVVAKIGLEQWRGEKEKLQKILHRRGITRFGKALSGHDPHLIWHLTHLLDTGRGSILMNQTAKEEIPGVTTICISQVLNVWNFLKQNPKESA